MLRKGSSPAVSRISLFPRAFTFRELPHQAPAGDLSCSGPSAHLRLASSPTSPCHPCLLMPCLTASLSHFESPLKTIFLFLPVFPPPLLLNSTAIVNLVPLAAASFDTESLIPRLGLKHGGESLEAERAKLISTHSNLRLVVRSKRSFYHTWITGIHRHYHLRGRE